MPTPNFSIRYLLYKANEITDETAPDADGDVTSYSDLYDAIHSDDYKHIYITGILYGDCGYNESTGQEGLFNDCTSLITVEFGPSFKIEQVTNLSHMFSGCRYLEKIILNKDYLSCYALTNVDNLFEECRNLKKIDLSAFSLSNPISAKSMFSGCRNLEKIIFNTYTYELSNCNGMFEDCMSLKDLDLSNFDTSNITDMSQMFYDCYDLRNLNLSNFDTSNVTNMSGMFYFCTINNQPWANFNTSSVEDMSQMFLGTEYISLDLSNFDTSNVTDMSNMFDSCGYLENIYVGDNWNLSNVIESDGMFDWCSFLPNFNSSITDKTKAYVGEGGYLKTKPEYVIQQYIEIDGIKFKVYPKTSNQ